MRAPVFPTAGLLPCVLLVCLTSASAPLAAVIVAGGDGAANTTAPALPAPFPYWDAIGKISLAGDSPPADARPWDRGGTATYLGNGYCLTAHHIRMLDDPVSVTFAEVTYAIDDDSWQRIESDTGGTDLTLFRLSGALPEVTPVPVDDIPGEGLSAGDTIYMMGFGWDRRPGKATWYVRGSDWLTAPPAPPYTVREGFMWADKKSVRWGTNTISNATPRSPNYGFGSTNTQYYETRFDDGAGGDEAQAAVGDSGGPAFVYDQGWKLVAVSLALKTFADQPAGAAVFGNSTYLADLTAYRGQGPLALVAPAGDANLDGTVDDDDLSLLLAHWGRQATWPIGDFDGDSLAADNDLSLLLTSWTDIAAGASVPEPSCLWLATAVAVILRRRKRR